MAHQKKILIVDDNPTNIKILEELFEEENQLEIATDGKECLEKTEVFNPDIILLDVMMPGMSGYDVCKQIKMTESGRLIPVIMVTSLSATEERIKGIEAGADDFISKPFDKNELLARVKSLLRIKSLHDELDNSYKKLKDLTHLKDNLTQMIVHDLKSPLVSIVLSLRALEEVSQEKLSEDDIEGLKIALEEVQNLQSMIDDILDIHKLEEGQMKLILSPIALDQLAKKTIERMKIVALHKKNTIKLEVADALPKLTGDNELIRRVIENLISNALKFNPIKGTIFVKVIYNDQENQFHIQIKDTGRGIPEEYLEKIFDKFIQVETDKVSTGRGLGLTFCKMVVEAHGGQIKVESKPGAGSQFTVILPGPT